MARKPASQSSDKPAARREPTRKEKRSDTHAAITGNTPAPVAVPTADIAEAKMTPINKQEPTQVHHLTLTGLVEEFARDDVVAVGFIATAKAAYRDGPQWAGEVFTKALSAYSERVAKAMEAYNANKPKAEQVTNWQKQCEAVWRQKGRPEGAAAEGLAAAMSAYRTAQARASELKAVIGAAWASAGFAYQVGLSSTVVNGPDGKPLPPVTKRTAIISEAATILRVRELDWTGTPKDTLRLQRQNAKAIKQAEKINGEADAAVGKALREGMAPEAVAQVRKAIEDKHATAALQEAVKKMADAATTEAAAILKHYGNNRDAAIQHAEKVLAILKAGQLDALM